ncbi:DUF1192 domain-containing protein [Xanthobacter autotrophicus]|uniref:DUF1192 domain-containing protein n=1 Tax=Xanthobacter TaxID=279 RepID=UPI0024AAB6F6|nr:DUF1192 domain-containing protein [Xanthobacter autotrophicus]MDI4664662.1 DUF1192 domain-containing protein [Xanthobacter autotrophicus]
MPMDDDALPPPREPLVAADISRLSVDEIEQRIADLRAEIARLEAALEAKRASRAAANAAFKL